MRAALECLLLVGSDLLADVACVVVHSCTGHALHMMRNETLRADAQAAVHCAVTSALDLHASRHPPES